MTKHYTAMAGISDCMPSICFAHETLDAAVDDLASIHELGARRKRVLKRDRYIELNLHKDDNEFAEIEECECDNPEQHND